jgi:hypothetical protein
MLDNVKQNKRSFATEYQDNTPNFLHQEDLLSYQSNQIVDLGLDEKLEIAERKLKQSGQNVVVTREDEDLLILDNTILNESNQREKGGAQLDLRDFLML